MYVERASGVPAEDPEDIYACTRVGVGLYRNHNIMLKLGGLDFPFLFWWLLWRFGQGNVKCFVIKIENIRFIFGFCSSFFSRWVISGGAEAKLGEQKLSGNKWTIHISIMYVVIIFIIAQVVANLFQSSNPRLLSTRISTRVQRKLDSDSSVLLRARTFKRATPIILHSNLFHPRVVSSKTLER